MLTACWRTPTCLPYGSSLCQPRQVVNQRGGVGRGVVLPQRGCFSTEGRGVNKVGWLLPKGRGSKGDFLGSLLPRGRGSKGDVLLFAFCWGDRFVFLSLHVVQCCRPCSNLTVLALSPWKSVTHSLVLVWKSMATRYDAIRRPDRLTEVPTDRLTYFPND